MKGQITIFIIIGLLVLIAFGVTLYAANSVRVQSSGTKTLDSLSIKPISDYVSTCLELAASESFVRMGLQGGVLYESQGGLTDEGVGKVAIGDVKMPLLVTKPVGNVGNLFFSDAPRFPFEGFPFVKGETILKGYYGQNELAPLYSISPDGKRVQGSIQESVEKAIEKELKICADFSSFKSRGLQLGLGEPQVGLVFARDQEQFEGERFVNVKLRWPIEITSVSADKKIISDFAIKIPLRLATIYYTAKKIIDADVTNIEYVPSGSNKIRVVSLEQEEFSVLKLSDRGSVVMNEPFEFWIARQNRIPALWKIDTSLLSKATFHVTPTGRGAKISVKGNILRIEDPCQEADIPNPFLLELKGSDADENKVVFEVEPIQIPKSAVTSGGFEVTVFAKDSQEGASFDFQKIGLQVALCEVR